MPGSTIIRGSARKTLFANESLSVTGSHGLGTFDSGLYARFDGLVSCVGSVTLNYAMMINSGGASIVSSAITVNSGSRIFDFLNYGREVDFFFSAANSQVLSILIQGEPTR